jgi:SAM-dependent methyltransferase
MDLSPGLTEILTAKLKDAAGPVLLLGPPELAEQLQHVVPHLLLADDATKPSRLARHSALAVVRAHGEALPIDDGSLAAILAVEALSRFASPQIVLAAWSRALRDGGRLLVVERLVQSLTMRTLHRLIEPSRHRLAPEDLTSLLLNAGYGRVAQLWPTTRQRALVTSAVRRRALP